MTPGRDADQPLRSFPDSLPGPVSLWLALLALGHRALIVAWTTTVSADSAYYLWMAEAFSKGQVDRTLESYAGFHPLFPVLTAVFGAPWGNLETGGYLVSVLAGGLGVVPLYYLVRELWNERIAWWTGLLYALHPPLSLESSEVMTTGPFLGMFLASLALWILALRGASWSYYPLGGILAALAYLTRPEGVALPLFLAAGAAAAWRAPEGGRGRLAGGVLLAALAWFVVAGPYVVWMHGVHGRWTITHRSSAGKLWSNLRQRLTPENPKADPPASTPAPAPKAPAPPPAPPDPASSAASTSIPVAGTPAGPPAIRDVDAPTPALSERKRVEGLPPSHAGPERTEESRRAPTLQPPPEAVNDPFLPVTVKKILQAVYWPLLPLMALGFAFHRRLGGRRMALPVVLVMLAVLWAPIILNFSLDRQYRPSHRYFLPGAVLLLPWAAAGAAVLYDALVRSKAVGGGFPPSPFGASAGPRSLGEGGRPRPGRLAVARAAFFAVLLAPLLYKTLRPHRREEASFIEAGAWLRAQAMPEPRRILSTSDKIAWYGGCGLAYPDLSPDPSRWVFLGEDVHPYWKPLPAGSDVSAAAAPGAKADLSAVAPAGAKADAPSCSGRVKLIWVCSRSWRPPFLAIDDDSLDDAEKLDIHRELESVGFRRVAAFGGTGTETKGVWIYNLP